MKNCPKKSNSFEYKNFYSAETKNYLFVLILFSTFSIIIYMASPEFHQTIAPEDGPIESATALFYLIGALLCLNAIHKKRYLAFSILWFLLCLLFLGEETSWFQRVLNYSVPGIENINAQSEFNIHNLDILQAHGKGRKFIDDDGNFEFAFHKLLTAQSIFRLGLITYFLIFPLLLHFNPFNEIATRLKMPAYDHQFLILMWSTIILTFVLTLLSDATARNAISEMREMFISIFIVYYVMTFTTSWKLNTEAEAHNLR